MTPERDDSDSARPGPQSVFLERRGYRRRRLADAARLLPILGAALFLIPLLWPEGGAGAPSPVRTSQAIIYIFGVWAGLIVVSALLGIGTRDWTQPDRPEKPGAD